MVCSEYALQTTEIDDVLIIANCASATAQHLITQKIFHS